MENNLLNKYLDNKEKSSKAHKWISKVLICIIILLVSLIATSFSPKMKELYQKYIFNDNFKFMEFKNFYEKLAGSRANENDDNDKNAKTVMAGDLEFVSSEKYLDGEKLIGPSSNMVKALTSGIVVYAAEKDDYGKTIIIQGSNGYDIWYAGLDNIDINIYDYIKEGAVIASASKELILVISKDGKHYTYEEYKSEIK